VIAAALIDKNQEHYGFDVDPEPPMEFETAKLEKPVDLRQVARASGMAYEDLAELNPELRTFVTPRDGSGYALRVPRGFSRSVEAKAAVLPEAAVPALRRHRVRSGDTLAKVAHRYGVSEASLAEANDLARGAKLAPRRMLEIPDPEPGVYAARRSGKTNHASPAASVARTHYRVRRGDTLFSIATRHHTTVDKLREWNGLGDGAPIRPGERIAVAGGR
jgi:membrane-bound lytic murein transglycosylase D